MAPTLHPHPMILTHRWIPTPLGGLFAWSSYPVCSSVLCKRWWPPPTLIPWYSPTGESPPFSKAWSPCPLCYSVLCRKWLPLHARILTHSWIPIPPWGLFVWFPCPLCCSVLCKRLLLPLLPGWNTWPGVLLSGDRQGSCPLLGRMSGSPNWRRENISHFIIINVYVKINS